MLSARWTTLIRLSGEAVALALGSDEALVVMLGSDEALVAMLGSDEALAMALGLDEALAMALGLDEALGLGWREATALLPLVADGAILNSYSDSSSVLARKISGPGIALCAAI